MVYGLCSVTGISNQWSAQPQAWTLFSDWHQQSVKRSTSSMDSVQWLASAVSEALDFKHGLCSVTGIGSQWSAQPQAAQRGRHCCQQGWFWWWQCGARTYRLSLSQASVERLVSAFSALRATWRSQRYQPDSRVRVVSVQYPKSL